MIMVIFFRSRLWPYIDSLIELSRGMAFDELSAYPKYRLGYEGSLRFLSGQEIKSALNSGNVCALSKKRRAMENAVEVMQGRISA